MEFSETRRNIDAEKASGRQGLKQDKAEEKQETSKQREDRNLRFCRKEPQVLEVANHDESDKSIWHDWAGQMHDKVSRMVSSLRENKSALLLGVMLASARGINVEGRPVRGGTALRLLDSNNTTNLPSLGWEGFNNLSHPTALEFNPNKVTPELLDHLRKVGVPDPEQHIRNIQQREQRQNMRQLAEKARENPEVLESVRNLFEEMPEKESSETNRRKLDKGTERLTPEKIDPEIWKSMGRMLTEKTPISDQQNDVTRRELNDNT